MRLLRWKRVKQVQLPQQDNKKARRVVSLEKKRDIHYLLLQGKTNSVTCHLHGVNESMIRTVRKAKTHIMARIVSWTPKSLKRCFMHADSRMERTEMLNPYTEDQQKNNEALSVQGICENAQGISKDMFSNTEVGPEKKSCWEQVMV